jgi:rhodanese-related sulfurtransferase
MFLKNFAELPPRKRIGILAIILGIFAAFIGEPTSKAKVSVNLKEISNLSVDDIAKVDVFSLADDIIKNKYDYRLVDLRSPEEYKKYNIPTSENIPVEKLLDSDLARNEKIVLYSDNDIVSTQGWFLLKAKNYNGVYTLKGGLKSWKDKILFPQCTCGTNPSIEQKQHHAQLAELSKFFGGKMRSESVDVAQSNMEMPTLKMPATIKLKKSKGKKKREGC